MEKEIVEILSKDKILKKIIAEVDVNWSNTKEKDIYFYLLKAITSQQLSTKAAATIWKRFLELFTNNYPDAEKLTHMLPEKLRTAGISMQKAGYLKNIAQFSIEKSLDYKVLNKLSDYDLIIYLTEIKGVGKWTAEMILMFALKRTNVLPLDDLGIQQAMQKAYGIDANNKKEMFLKMEQIADKWQPYKTIASMYLWNWKDLKKQ